MKKKMNYLFLLITTILMVGCTNVDDTSSTDGETDSQEVTTVNTDNNSEKEETIPTVVDEPIAEETPTQSNDEQFDGYETLEVDGGDLSGSREANVVVDIGYGDREYWAFTNEYGQLVRVIADKIVLQDDSKEHVTSSGRYY